MEVLAMIWSLHWNWCEYPMNFIAIGMKIVVTIWSTSRTKLEVSRTMVAEQNGPHFRISERFSTPSQLNSCINLNNWGSRFQITDKMLSSNVERLVNWQLRARKQRQWPPFSQRPIYKINNLVFFPRIVSAESRRSEFWNERSTLWEANEIRSHFEWAQEGFHYFTFQYQFHPNWNIVSCGSIGFPKNIRTVHYTQINKTKKKLQRDIMIMKWRKLSAWFSSV